MWKVKWIGVKDNQPYNRDDQADSLQLLWSPHHRGIYTHAGHFLETAEVWKYQLCVCMGGVLQILKFCDCITEILTLVTLASNERTTALNWDQMPSRMVIKCTDVSISVLFIWLQSDDY